MENQIWCFNISAFILVLLTILLIILKEYFNKNVLF